MGTPFERFPLSNDQVPPLLDNHLDLKVEEAASPTNDVMILALQQRQQQLQREKRSSSSVCANNKTSSLSRDGQTPEQAEQMQRSLQQWHGSILPQSQLLIEALLNADSQPAPYHHQQPALLLRNKQSSTKSYALTFDLGDSLSPTSWHDIHQGKTPSTSQKSTSYLATPALPWHQPPPEPDTRSSTTKTSDRPYKSSWFVGFSGPIRAMKRAHSIREHDVMGKSDDSRNSSKRHRSWKVDNVTAADADKEASGFCLSANSSLDREMDKALLHHSCRLYAHDLSIVQCALELDPDAVRREVSTECPCSNNFVLRTICAKASMDDGHSARSVMCPIGDIDSTTDDDECSCEVYKYPINVALKHNAPLEVVQLLAQKAPDVLTLSDGPDQCGSLSIFLQHCQYSSSSTAESNAQIVHCLINASRESASALDRHQNTPLHYAVRAAHNLTQVALQEIHSAYPTALRQSNFHGRDPVDLAIRSSTPLPVVDWLQTLRHKHMEQDFDRDFDQLLPEEFMSSDFGTTSNPSINSLPNFRRTTSQSLLAENGGYFFY